MTKAVFTASDDYKDSVAIANALNPDALLAWEMNGAPLTKAHGFPARLLIPGIYGMKNVKWIERITLVNTDFLGYWQHQGWNDAAPYQTASRIDTPTLAALPGGRHGDGRGRGLRGRPRDPDGRGQHGRREDLARGAGQARAVGE